MLLTELSRPVCSGRSHLSSYMGFQHRYTFTKGNLEICSEIVKIRCRKNHSIIPNDEMIDKIMRAANSKFKKKIGKIVVGLLI